MGKETDCWQRAPKRVKEGNSPKHHGQYKLGFERVEIVRKAADEHCWKEIHSFRKEPWREKSSLQHEHINSRMFLTTITLKRVLKSEFLPPCGNS